MLIKYRNVDICQESQEVLDDINLTVNEKEFIYLTGKVGSGKSSLLKTMYCELPVSSGEASVMGFDITKIKMKKVPELRKKMGIIFQDFQLLNDRTVEANLRFVLKATGWKDKGKIKERIAEVLQLVGMETKGYKLPSELSGGEQQRIAIARSMLNSPALILADEPTGNLDTETSMQIVGLLRQLVEEQGTTVVMITHNMQIVEKFPGRVIVCADKHLYENGQVVNDTDPEEESKDSTSEVVSNENQEEETEQATEKEAAAETEDVKENKGATEEVTLVKEETKTENEVNEEDDDDSIFCEEDAFSFDITGNSPVNNLPDEHVQVDQQESLTDEAKALEENKENSQQKGDDKQEAVETTNGNEDEQKGEEEENVDKEPDCQTQNHNNFQNDFHKKKKKNKKHKRR